MEHNVCNLNISPFNSASNDLELVERVAKSEEAQKDSNQLWRAISDRLSDTGPESSWSLQVEVGSRGTGLLRRVDVAVPDRAAEHSFRPAIKPFEFVVKISYEIIKTRMSA